MKALQTEPRAVVVEVDKEMRVPGYESWWDVQISEVSEIGTIRVRPRKIRRSSQERSGVTR